MVKLLRIDHDNWLDCIALQVADDQQRFVNPNIFSLAEAFVHSDANPDCAEEYYRCLPYAICADDELVGFAMLTYERECDYDSLPAYEIYRLMISHEHQGNGYGHSAVMELLSIAASLPCGPAEAVYAQWHPENTASTQLFLSCGFDIIPCDGEEVTAKYSIAT